GAAQASLGRYQDALAAYQRSIAIEPTRGGYVNLGVCYYSLGRYAESADMFEKAAALQPKQYQVWFDLGDAYRWAPGQRGKSADAYDRAIKLARESLAVNPNDVYAHVVIASCLAKRGDLAAADAEMKIALQ